jgi:nucleotide-binding universal stress UspA family protein
MRLMCAPLDLSALKMTPPDEDHVAVASAAVVERPPLRTGPTLIAYDGTPAANWAIFEAAALLKGHKTLVVTVWKPGLAFELMELPTATIGLPPAPIDIRTAMEIDEQLYEAARRMADQGAQIAREAGLEVEGLAVAEEVEVTIAETINSVALERDAEAIVMGLQERGRLSEVILGSTTREVIRHARCPVLVARRPKRT